MVRGWAIGLSLLASCAPLVASAQDSPKAPAGIDQGQAVKGQPKGNPATWFTDLDYPADAKRAGAQGSVSVVLGIDTSGRIVDCRVSASSGNASLDATTCWLAKRRGRFTIQKDASGQPQPYSYVVSTTWSPSK